jgi:hypothetical protein
MAVGVDEAGQDIHAGGIDLARRIARRPPLRQRQAGRAGAVDALDPVAGDDDVDRPARRRAGAVDQHGAADHQPGIGAFAFARLAVGHPLHPRRRLLRPERAERGKARRQHRRRHAIFEPAHLSPP